MSSKPTYKFDYLVFIGRFQPMHIGHLSVIEKALRLAEQLIIVVGSSYQPRTPKNPWTSGERKEMILQSLKAEGIDYERVRFAEVRDQMYNDQSWAADVQDAVETAKTGWHDYDTFGIIGHQKDETSYYLKMFPQWDLVEHDMNEAVSSTDIRQLYFEGLNTKFLQSIVPAPVFSWLEQFKTKAPYERLVREYNFIKGYKKQFEQLKYPPVFVTADAVVIQSGHVLLVERKASPGEGLNALPGGFIKSTELIEAACLRELREETKLKVPLPVLKGSIVKSKVFDAPNRSLRGRTITHAFLIELPPGELPPVKGSDDAKKAFWVPISKIKSEEMFEDHYDLLKYFLGGV